MKKVILLASLLPLMAHGQPLHYALPGEVVISEIMADPSPVIALPDREYLELTNTSESVADMAGWKIQAGGKDYLIPDVRLGPGEIIILCPAADTALFRQYGRTAGMKQFPVLTDGGRLLCLLNGTGQLIHGVEYSSGWYRNDLKDDGGWSLEMIDAGMPFYAQANWTASLSASGGSPGKVNSVRRVNPDRWFTGVTNVFPNDSMTLMVSFSEPVLCISRLEECTVSGIRTTAAVPAEPLFRMFLFRLNSPVEKGLQYEFNAPINLHDFAGNVAQKTSFIFGMAEKAHHGDVLFNELLFNPLPGDGDYIEVYNASGRIIDISELSVVSVSDDMADTSDLYKLSNEKRCFLPGTYYAVTESGMKTAERYPSSDISCILEAGGLPSMNDDEGHLILFNRELVLIDEVRYTEKMHFSLLDSFEGISLEKTDPRSASGIAENWHSASEMAGWGTPGARNSIFSDNEIASGSISFSSSRITPDNDGTEDYLSIGFSLPGNSNVISVTVFDEAGNSVRKLASTMLSGSEGSLVWDGIADDGSPVRSGIYIVLITAYNDAGKSYRWKKACTLIRR